MIYFIWVGLRYVTMHEEKLDTSYEIYSLSEEPRRMMLEVSIESSHFIQKNSSHNRI